MAIAQRNVLISVLQQHHHKNPEDYGWWLKCQLKSRLSDELEDVRRDRVERTSKAEKLIASFFPIGGIYLNSCYV
ncbi:hypothetical protein H6F74_20325 [Trichocoleus sp. FACHB-90]|uniref:hypothetical protein n=1 Tax=Cyanophyceae TaxID=3028117 RepID=UPI0016821C7D|nr:hypothetical protein [Trichocoleus sp. FACHB-90]MBD1928577.1 hypothetical protein [Trichocoleus sp. FACHB-90]